MPHEEKVESIRTPWQELAEALSEIAQDDPELAAAVTTVNRVMRCAHLAGVMRFGPGVDPEALIAWCESFTRAVLELAAPSDDEE